MVAARSFFRKSVEIGGAGRTDAGVHAVRQIAHLKVAELKTNITPRQIQHGFNDLLPHDINIIKVPTRRDNFHARHRCCRALLSLSNFDAPDGFRQKFRLVDKRSSERRGNAGSGGNARRQARFSIVYGN